MKKRSQKKTAIYESTHSYQSLPVAAPFSANPDVVRVVVEGERLTYGHLFNPAFATEISLIEPLPHQRMAVYEHMLKFTIVAGSDAKSGNPFVGAESYLLIVSVDTLRGDTMFSRLQEPDVIPYDLVIFDEAHKLAADREPDLRMRRTDRYRLAEALASVPSEDARWALSWRCHHLLLLTATPHMGKDYPYYCLWRLLEPDALATIDAFNAYPMDARHRHFIRRTKEELVYFDGKPTYPPRYSDTLSYALSTGEVSEQRLYDETTSYIQTYYNRAEVLNRSAARLAMSVFQRRLASSTDALLRSFQRRRQKLATLVDAMRSGKLHPAKLKETQSTLDKKISSVFDEKTADEEEILVDKEENELAEDQAMDGVLATTLAELEAVRNI